MPDVRGCASKLKNESVEGGALLSPQLESLFETLEVTLDAFAVCEIGRGWSLQCRPLERTLVHFVLRGSGCIDWPEGALPLERGAVVLVPKQLPKDIHGPGPVRNVAQMDDICPMADGIIKFRAGRAEPGLMLGCATIQALTQDGRNLLGGLRAPLLEHVERDALSPLFTTMLAELSSPRPGTRAIVSLMMKQLMLLFLRRHLERTVADSPLSLPPVDPRLGRALHAMTNNPDAPHTIDSLAQMAGMSRSRFAHHFSAAYGRSPMQFLHRERLASAARMLRTSDLPVKAVAAAVGYASRSHFSRSFRDRFGVDPSAYCDGRRGSADAPLTLAS